MQAVDINQVEEQNNGIFLNQSISMPLFMKESSLLSASQIINPSDISFSTFPFYSQLIPNKLHKNPFSIEEDKLILKLVEIIGENNWVDIAKYMKKKNFDRNSRQCRDRYYHYLNPNINKLTWSKEEDDLLLEKVENEGKKWKKFEKFFHRRTEVQLRNRYNLLARKIEKNEKKKEKKIEKKRNIMSDSFSFLDSYYAGIRKRYLAKRFAGAIKSTENVSNQNDNNFCFSEDAQTNDEDLDFSIFPLLDDINDFDDSFIL